jgi:hypothetical protein
MPITQTNLVKREFKVFRKSENLNSFGLRGYWIMDRQGNAFEFATHDGNEMERGQVITLNEAIIDRMPNRDWELINRLQWAGLMGVFEIPESKGKAPSGVVDLIWNKPVSEW